MSSEQIGHSPGDGSPRPAARISERQSVLLVLAVLGAVAALWLVPGVFTIDENHALAWLVSLRAGRFSLPGTDGLPRSPELLFFDPVARLHPGAPITSLVPPLYALFALPFSLAGWTGLFLLNLAAWLVTIALVRSAARHAGASPSAAWIGAMAFALAGFSLEYALGMWPHALAACLVLAAFLAALNAVESGRAGPAMAAGLLAGLASGIRYQHIVTATLIGLVLVLTSARRRRMVAAYTAGLALPLALSTVANGLRAGIWHPLSKGPGYVALSGLGGKDSAWDPLRAFGAQVLDFSLQRHLPYWQNIGGRWTGTGAFLLLSAVKKALLQSAPWVLIVMLALVAAWSRRAPDRPARRILRAIAIVMAGVLLFFALSGTKRYDGWCHNPRYLLDLLPLTALALALLVESAGLHWRPLVLGALAGALLALPPLLLSPASTVRQLALLYGPLALALASAILFQLARRRPSLQRGLAPALGVLLGWACAVHLGDDLRAARALRSANLGKLEAVEALMPDVPAALFAHQPTAFGPLLLERNVVIADTGVDRGNDAAALVDAFRHAGRRIFAVLPGMPDDERRALTAGRRVRPVGETGSPFVELVF